jgi:putative ABC transport system ATP-binding protein
MEHQNNSFDLEKEPNIQPDNLLKDTLELDQDPFLSYQREDNKDDQPRESLNIAFEGMRESNDIKEMHEETFFSTVEDNSQNKKDLFENLFTDKVGRIDIESEKDLLNVDHLEFKKKSSASDQFYEVSPEDEKNDVIVIKNGKEGEIVEVQRDIYGGNQEEDAEQITDDEDVRDPKTDFNNFDFGENKKTNRIQIDNQTQIDETKQFNQEDNSTSVKHSISTVKPFANNSNVSLNLQQTSQNKKEIELTNQSHSKQQRPESLIDFKYSSVTSLGKSSFAKKDFTKDQILIGKGYSQNLLKAMNDYSLVLDHVKMKQKKVNNPYHNKTEMLELKNVHKTYLVGLEGVSAIRGIDLKIYEGEFLMIYGKSGGGKSSLLNLIGTIDEPNKGSIRMNNHGFLDCLKDNQLSDIRLKNIGFVFQSFNLINSLTALENIKMPMLLKGVLSSKEIHDRAMDLMKQLGILHRKDSYPKQMSGGEQQRVTIARAISNKPKMLLLDEPTGDLDSKNSLIVLKILLDLNIKEKITMVMVTHDENVKDLANRIVYVVDGKINRCVINPKEKRKVAVQSILNKADEAVRNENDIDRHASSVVKKSFRNPTYHPFFQYLKQKGRV